MEREGSGGDVRRALGRVLEQQKLQMKMEWVQGKKGALDEVDDTPDPQTQENETTQTDQIPTRFTSYQPGRSLVDIMASLYGVTAENLVHLYHLNSPAFRARINTLSGLWVRFNHVAKSWNLKLVSCSEFDARTATCEVTREDGSNAMVTVGNYFRDKYRIELRWPRLQLVALSTLEDKDKFLVEACFCAEDQASDDQIERLFSHLTHQKTKCEVHVRSHLHLPETGYLSGDNPGVKERCTEYMFKYSCHGMKMVVPCGRHEKLDVECLSPGRLRILYNQLYPVCIKVESAKEVGEMA